MMSKFLAGFCWYLIHLLLGVLHALSHLIHILECCAISIGLAGKYRNLDLEKLQNLAIVVDSEEAKCFHKINQLLQWLSVFGVKNVILYDREGILKKTMGSDMMRFTNKQAVHTATVQNLKATFLPHEKMAVELLSSSNGKEGVAKAANFLFSRYLSGDNSNLNIAEPVFTEADMARALLAVGSGGPDPDLLLVYGPARCHLGFPAWRLRYTEIIHMGQLKSSSYGALVKALYEFSKKHQNYG